MAQAQQVNYTTTLFPWLDAGNFSHEGKVVKSEDLRGRMDLFRLAREAYEEAVTPEEEKKERKKRESRRAHFLLIVDGKKIAHETVDYAQRLNRADTAEAFTAMQSLESGDASVICLVENADSIEIEGAKLEDVLALLAPNG